MKDIGKAAREYAEKQYPNANPNDAPYHTTGDSWDDCYDAFLAGAQSRQSEIDELIEALEEMRWIPVSERLPEAENIDALDWSKTYPVLVLSRNGKVTIGMRYWNSILNKWEWRGSGAFRDSITHWRPTDTPKATQLLEKYGKK